MKKIEDKMSKYMMERLPAFAVFLSTFRTVVLFNKSSTILASLVDPDFMFTHSSKKSYYSYLLNR